MITVPKDIQLDHEVILDLIELQSTVLDLGCGTGDLLYLLADLPEQKDHGLIHKSIPLCLTICCPDILVL